MLERFSLERRPLESLGLATSAGNNVSGNADFGFSLSATITGIGAIAGGTNLDFASSATVQVPSLSGDASFTFTNAATITGVGSLSGDATFAFANSGTLTGIGAVSGSTGLDFASSGTVLGIGSVSGNTTLDFAQSGTAAAAGSNDVSGNTGLDFGLSGTLTPQAGSIQADGDIGARLSRKKPLVFIRPKAERELDDILEIIDSVSESDRVSENKRKLKQAKALIQKVDVPEQYQEPVEIVKKSIISLAREAAVHEGLKTKLMTASLQIEAIVAAMEQQRKRRKRDEEVIAWLV